MYLFFTWVGQTRNFMLVNALGYMEKSVAQQMNMNKPRKIWCIFRAHRKKIPTFRIYDFNLIEAL